MITLVKTPVWYAAHWQPHTIAQVTQANCQSTLAAQAPKAVTYNHCTSNLRSLRQALTVHM